MNKIFVHCSLPKKELEILKKNFLLKIHHSKNIVLNEDEFFIKAKGFNGIISQGNVINKNFIKANKNNVGKYFYSLLDNRTYKLVDTAKGTDLVPLGSLDTEGENQPSEGDLGFEQTEYQKEIARKTEEALKRKKEEQRKKVLESLPSNAFDEGF